MAADRIESSFLEGLNAGTGLPLGFNFSQGSLQDYKDCQRRFWLRYLLRLAWPAVQTEPVVENERALQQGERFHRLVQQYWLGVPADRLEAMIHDDELHGWWEQFTRYAESLRGAQRYYPEVGLSASLGDQRLIAKYDLIALSAEGRFTIFDWKTAHHNPRRLWLAERLQTRVYPYLLVRAGASFNAGEPIPPESVEMVYWFPAHPDQPVRFKYNARQYAVDQATLEGLAQEIARRAGSPVASEAFPLTDQVQRCAYCVYRSLCERGERAGSMEAGEQGTESEPYQEITLNFEQIAEIEF